MKFGDLNIEISDNIVKFGGNFTYKSGKNSIEFIAKNITQNSMLDFSNLDEIDYASAILLNKIIAKFDLKMFNANERVARVIEFCAVINRQIIPPKRPNLFSQIGKSHRRRRDLRCFYRLFDLVFSRRCVGLYRC